jgi:hypothetical protein
MGAVFFICVISGYALSLPVIRVKRVLLGML